MGEDGEIAKSKVDDDDEEDIDLLLSQFPKL